MSSENTNNTTITEDTTNLRGLISKILYHWPLYLLLLILSVSCAYIYLTYKKPVFSSTSKIYIKDDNKSGASGSVEDLALFGSDKVVNNEMEVIKSPLILEDVIKNNNFNVRYFRKGRLTSKEMYRSSPLKINILGDSTKVGNYLFDITLRDDRKVDLSYQENSKNFKTITVQLNQPFQVYKDQFSVNYFSNTIPEESRSYQIQIDSILPLAYRKSNEINTAVSNGGGSILELTYEDEVPERTADFLNSVLDTYNRYTLEDKNKIALNTIKFIDTRLQSLGGELSSVEREVESFKRARGITEIGENAQLYLDQVKDADQRLNVAQLQLEIYNQIERYINSPESEADITPALGNIDQGLVGVINQFQELLRERRRLSLSLQPGNQILQNLEQQISATKETIRSYVANYRRSAVTTKNSLQRTVNQIEGKISQVPGYEREFINIKRQQGVKEGLYSYLLQKREESAVVAASNIIDNKIIAPAFIPVNPIKPNRNLVILGFVIGGFVLGTAYLFFKYSTNRNVTDKDFLKKEFKTPIIAEIFEQTTIAAKQNAFEERSVLKEQMLNLRNNLKFMLTGVKTPVLMFTSSISGEGKTFLSSHLGNSLTYNNNSAVLIELDLRKPKLSKSLGIDNSEGVTDYLIGLKDLSQIIKKVPNTERLYVIPSGKIPPNPVELLESDRMKLMLDSLKERFNYIIIDTSPIGLVSDAKSLSPLVDCLLFVVRFNHTPKAKLKEVFEDLGSANFKKEGLIFNGVDVKSSYAYSYGYSEYSYGYSDTSSKGAFLPSFWKGFRRRIL